LASQPDRRLGQAFRFDAGDLRANRQGRLSPRQDARLRAGLTGMRLSLAVFAVVMLGTLGVVAFSNWNLTGSALGEGGPVAMGVIAAVVGVVIALGVWQSRGFMTAARSRRIQVATGLAEVVSEGPDEYHVRVGPTRLRLASEEQLQALSPGTEYAVYYLAGRVSTVLSAEPVGAGSASGPAAPAPSERDGQVTVIRRGYVIVAMIGALALGMPLAGIAAGRLSEGLRSAVWIGLLVLAIGFAWFAVRWLTRSVTPGGRRRGRGPGR
jgi:hypothetical protein